MLNEKRFAVIFHKGRQNEQSNKCFKTPESAIAHVRNIEITDHILYKEYKNGGLVEIFDNQNQCSLERGFKNI